MSIYFSRLHSQNTYDWTILRQNGSQEKSLFQAVLNKDQEAVDLFLKTPKVLPQEEINGSLFAAYTMDNAVAVQKIFPYASTSGVEAGKSCLIGSTYINNLELFNDTATWLKKHGENALKKKDVRNHCLLNLSAFNHIDKVQDLLKASKSTLKNDSAVQDFCTSIAYPAARYGSQELMELAVSISEDYFKSNSQYFNSLIVRALGILSSLYPSETGAQRTLTSDAHNQVFEWLLTKYDAQHFTGLLRYSSQYNLDPDRLVEVLKRFDESALQKEMSLLSSFSHLTSVHQAYELFLTRRQKDILNDNIGAAGASSSSRKM